MPSMSIAQVKNRPSSQIPGVEQGEEVVRLLATQPVQASKTVAELEAQALAELDAVRQNLRGKVTLTDIQALRDEGRRF